MKRAPISTALILVLAMGAAPCYAQYSAERDREREPAWLSLERGQRAYAEKKFGQAMVDFDMAIAKRRDSFAAAATRLDAVLLLKTAKKAGPSIDAVLAAYAAEDFIQRDYKAIVDAHGPTRASLLEAIRKERISDSHRTFIDVLLLVLQYRTIESLGDSTATLRAEVALLAQYPEAEYWKGKIFFIEGEHGLAETQFLRAFDMRESLDVPEDRYSILYAIASLYEARNDFVAWENVLGRILTGDTIGGGSVVVDISVDPFMKDAMIKTLLNSGFDKFMTLYRIEPSYSLEANSSLARFYLERGRAAATLHAAVAINMILTRAIEMLKTKDRDYIWRGLYDFRDRIEARRDVASYLADNGFDRLMLTLADALYIDGSRTGAAELWTYIAASGQLPYSRVAAGRLSKPGSAVRRAVP